MKRVRRVKRILTSTLERVGLLVLAVLGYGAAMASGVYAHFVQCSIKEGFLLLSIIILGITIGTLSLNTLTERK